VLADWLFVVGISLEISGAALIAGEFLFESREDAAERGNVLTLTDGPSRDAQRGAAFAWIGVCIIVAGFLLQLSGYVASAGDLWFVGVAVLAAGLSFGTGLWLATGPAQTLLLRRAEDAWNAMKADALHRQHVDKHG
jgi:hypothetical protein